MGMSMIAILAAHVLLFPLGHGPAKRSAAVQHKIAPSSGKELCSALMPADFNKAGVAVTAVGAQNIDDPANAYCTYKIKSGYPPEFDLFYPAGDSVVAAIGTERTIYGEVGARFQPVPFPAWSRRK